MTDIIFFDLDGPILDGKMKHYMCYSEIIKKLNGTPIDIDRYWLMKKNKNSVNEILQLSNLENENAIENFKRKWISDIEKKETLNLDVLKKDIMKILLLLQSEYELILVTRRNNCENLVWQLKREKIHNYFNRIFCCPRSDYASKYEAIKHIKFKNAIFIGDTEEDGETAKILGIPFVGILNGLRAKETLSADWYFNDVFEISDFSLLFN